VLVALGIDLQQYLLFWQQNSTKYSIEQALIVDAE
jgi:hypothetical protein